MTAVYRALMIEIEARRLAHGISQEKMSELMGTADRSFAKMIYPDTVSGRRGRWETVQLALEALFPAGFAVKLEKSTAPLCPSGTARRIQGEAAHWDAHTRRERMRELQKLGVPSYMATSTPEQRAERAGGPCAHVG